jgi:hypothetical protein
MEIEDWTQRPDGRRAFQATQLTEGAVYDTWVGDLGRRLEFTSASQNPIIYWSLHPKRTTRD